MDIYIIRQEQETGPYTVEAARTLLTQGAVMADDFAWSEGLENWIPLNDLLGPIAEEPLAEPPAPAPAKTEPATPKQKALLSFLNIPLPAEITRDQAARLVNDAMEDPHNAGRLTQWNEERLRLHPELFAAEIEAKKGNRAAHFLELCQSTGAEYFSGIAKAHCQVLVGFLDVKFPHWDARETDAAEHYFFPAVAEKFPQLVNKAWRGRLHYSDSPKAAPRTDRQSSTSKLRRSGTSPLVAITRGVILGLVILAGLYLAQRTLYHSSTASPPAEVSTEPPPPPAAQPTPLPVDPVPRADAPPDLPLIEPLPPIAPVEPAPAESAPFVPPTPDPTINPVPMAATPIAPMTAPEPAPPMAAAGSSMSPSTPMAPMALETAAVATAPMAALPGAEPPVSLPPPLAAMPVSELPAGLPPEAAAIPPLTPGDLPPAATALPAAKTNLLLTKPVEALFAYGQVTLPPGTPVKLLDRQGATLRVSYGGSVLTVPASSTDAE